MGARWQYSRPYFYTLRKTGDAPDVIGKGKAQRITDVAEARWLKRQEQKARARLMRSRDVDESKPISDEPRAIVASAKRR